ncbi:hypothetical protein FNV43_RR23659 [Rhamnella rubrinervis]|uniref:Agenet domain-containing protein n=1 Tax=Rhamnella rubrinervis TaxID=2594499 RepID=A0A8K0E481_9ROSA|nr:hypothetical protein FNV43_RR23659 [Rhamnella rubrinervis]
MVVGSDPNEPRQQLPFVVGSEVEVCSDEDGFKGAWFRATIVESPTSSASKKRKKTLVEYKNLVTDDGSRQLREYVDSICIRPLPPHVSDHDFEEGDAVDADYRDGWWTGIIRKVLNNSKYRVFFDNPPDVIEFDLINLRLHQDWVGGKWVRSQRQQMIGSTFSSGADVEVSFEKEDLCDAWFPAIVIEGNENKTFLVKYKNPVAMLGKVEALCDFAWRAGVIAKVFAGRMYAVKFKHGTKDRELRHSEIRPLMEWKDGKWNIGYKEGLITSTLQDEIENGPKNTTDPVVAFQLESLSAVSSAKDNPEKKVPLPANSRKNLELPTHCNKKSASLASIPSMRNVDLPASNGNTRHLRPSKKLIDGNSETSPLSLTAYQMRNKRKSLSTPTREYKGIRHSRKPVIDNQLSKTESKFEEKIHRTKRLKDGLVDPQRTDPVKGKGRQTKSQLKSPLTASIGKEGNVSCTAEKLVDNEAMQKESELLVISESSAKGMEDLLTENHGQLPNEDFSKLMRDPKNSNDPTEDKNVVVSAQLASDSVMADLLRSLVLLPNMEFKQQQAGGSSHKRKRGRPRKLMVFGPRASEEVKHQNGAGNVAEEVIKDCTSDEVTSDEVALPIHRAMETTDSQNDSRSKKTEVSGRKYMTNEAGATHVGATNGTDDDDQPLSTWFGGIQCPLSVSESRLFPVRIVDQWSEPTGQANIGRQSPAIDATGESVADENKKLPFVKSSPVWKMIETMNVFRMMPQNPHFRPLSECKEEHREGMAIGHMVTFSSLVDKIYKLQFDDFESIFHSICESLNDLEKHGFDVTVLRGRVVELLSIKEKQGQFRNESTDAENKITEHTRQKTKLVEEMDDIARKISELQEKLASIKSEMEGEGHEITKLRLQVNAVNQRILGARLDFDKLAAAPLKFA